MDLAISRSDSPPTSNSLKVREEQAKEARKEQLRRCREWEGSHGDEVAVKQVRQKRQRPIVMFEAKHLLWDAVQNLDIIEMCDILTSGSATPDLTSEATGVSLLHVCCINNYLPGVQLLLEHGANVNIQDNDLWTPLHVATACGYTDIIKLLLANKADCTLLDVDGNFACDSARDPEIRALLLKHMSLNGIYESDMRFLRSRMAKAMLAAVKECIVRMMDLNTLNSNGVAPMHVAAANGYREAAMLLIDLGGADVNIEDDLGYTPLHIAAKYNQSKLVYLLLTRGADLTVLSSKLETPSDLTDEDEILGLLSMAGEDQLKEPQVRPSFLPMTMPPLTPSKVDTVSIDMEQFESPQTKSKSIDLETPISKLEALFEGETLTDRENFDEGVDVSTQRPALRRLRGSLFQKRTSGSLDLPSPSSTDNLATLSDLTEDILLQFLRDRYHGDQIYTYIGEILVAINPFKTLTVYNNQASELYCTKVPDPTLSPHVFAVANQIYRNMLVERKPQTCVISGESGAGKTETSKYLVQQLLFISDSVERELNVKIEQVNPILEAFGNAMTVMNNNSSRFGKFLELSFTDDGQVLGATYKEYLLEKSRVVSHGKGERNFHIFYQLFAGLSAEEQAELGLGDMEKYRCLMGDGDHTADIITPKMTEDFSEVRDSLEAIGFSRQEENNVLQTLAAVLHITDLTFEPQEEGVELSNSSRTSLIADLLLLDEKELAVCLICEAMITRGEVIVRQRTLLQARDCRDAVAKALYGRMFGWIVNGINHHLQPENLLAGHFAKIGVLDIFGFENFKKNSFEQMCINLANEQLQHFFNEHVFKWEEEECLQEGVATDQVTYESNWPVVDLFLAKNAGIFALVDEESRFPRATDHTLATKLHKAHGECGVYRAPPDKGSKFVVSHYAGSVTYDMVGFLDKNRDTLPPSILQLLRTSGSMLVREIFEGKLTHTGSVTPSRRQKMSRKAESPYSQFNRKNSRRLTRISRKNAQRSPLRKPVEGRRALPTVGNHFKNSLSELMDKLNSSSPHFIRCIKPNSTKLPNSFDPSYVTRQLKYTGVMETTRIRQSGYPVRLTYGEFLKRYNVLKEFYTYQPNKTPLVDEHAVGVVLKKVGVSDWARGQRKVFLKFNHPVELERLSQQVLLHIISIQRWFRELKEWKAAQEALRQRRERAKLALTSSVTNSHSQASSNSTDMAYRKRNGHGPSHQGWNEAQHRGGLSQNAKNSNHNNSRGLKEVTLPTCPPNWPPKDREYVNIDNEDIYDSVVDPPNTEEPDTPEAEIGRVLQIKSLPLNDGIISMSVPEPEGEEIYDDADSVLQAASQHADYYNYDEDAVDEIYDDMSSALTKAQSTVPVNDSMTAEPPMIEEDVYDDTCVTEFRSLHTESSSSQDIEEMYSDASSMFNQPPPPKQPWTNAKRPPPLPPTSSIPHQEEEAVYSDAASVFHSPPGQMKLLSQSSEHLETLQEDEEAVYNDASSIFDYPPAPSKPSSHSPKLPARDQVSQSEEYTYLSEIDLDGALSDISAEPSPVQKQSTGPPPPPLPSRASRTGRMSKSVSVPVVLKDEPPPLPAPRRSSEQLFAPPRPSREYVPEVTSPNSQRAVTRQRSRAVKGRSVSDSSAPVLPPPRVSPSQSPFGSVEKLDQQKAGSRLSSSPRDIGTPPAHARLGKRHSEPFASSSYRQQLPLPPIPAAVSVNHYRDRPSLTVGGPSEEDYTEIDCEEILSYETNGRNPQDYLTPVKQKAHRKLQESKSTGDVSQRKHSDTSINSRPKAPLPSGALNNPTAGPPKPPRTRSISTGSPGIPARAARLLAGTPAPPQRNVQLPEIPTGPPPPPPTRRESTALTTPVLSRDKRLPDTPTTPPVPTRTTSVVTSPRVLNRNDQLPDTPTTPPPPLPVKRRNLATIASQPSPNAHSPPAIPQAPPITTPPGAPPPPPPPPPGGLARPPAPKQTSSSDSSPGFLLSGLQNVQLKKSSERAPVKPPPPQSGGRSPGNLMAEMHSFKLRKTQQPGISDAQPDGGSGSSVVSQKPQLRKAAPPIPDRRVTPAMNGSVTVPYPPPHHHNGMPDWKKAIVDRKRREQEEYLRAQQEAEEKWAGVPQWKRKLLEERAAAKAGGV